MQLREDLDSVVLGAVVLLSEALPGIALTWCSSEATGPQLHHLLSLQAGLYSCLSAWEIFKTLGQLYLIQIAASGSTLTSSTSWVGCLAQEPWATRSQARGPNEIFMEMHRHRCQLLPHLHLDSVMIASSFLYADGIISMEMDSQLLPHLHLDRVMAASSFLHTNGIISMEMDSQLLPGGSLNSWMDEVYRQKATVMSRCPEFGPPAVQMRQPPDVQMRLPARLRRHCFRGDARWKDHWHRMTHRMTHEQRGWVTVALSTDQAVTVSEALRLAFPAAHEPFFAEQKEEV